MLKNNYQFEGPGLLLTSLQSHLNQAYSLKIFIE